MTSDDKFGVTQIAVKVATRSPKLQHSLASGYTTGGRREYVLEGSLKNGVLAVYAPPDCDPDALPSIAEALRDAGFANIVIVPPRRSCADALTPEIDTSRATS